MRWLHWIGQALAAVSAVAFGGMSALVGYASGLGETSSNVPMMLAGAALVLAAPFVFMTGRRRVALIIIVVASVISYGAFLLMVGGFGHEFDEFAELFVLAMLMAFGLMWVGRPR